MEKQEINLFGVRGWLTARVRRRGSGELVELWTIPVKNTIVNGGLAQVALLWGDSAANAFTKGLIGEGTTTPTVGDTALEDQVDSQTGTFSREQTSVPNDTAVLVSMHTAPVGGWAITEYAAANADGTPTIYNRVTFAAINLAESEQLQFTYKTQITRV